MNNEKYHAFWRRLFAVVIDVTLLKPLEWTDAYIFSSSIDSYGLMAWGLFYSVIGIFYYVSMHALFGQTIGKMVTRIKVMDVSENRYLRVHQACLREILPILLIPLSLFMHYQFAFLGMTKESISQQAWAIYFGYSIFFWVLLEMVSMLFNGKRRAIHDFIAGSVVVKTNLTMHSTGLASLAR